jgi:hypothetical protein
VPGHRLLARTRCPRRIAASRAKQQRSAAESSFHSGRPAGALAARAATTAIADVSSRLPASHAYASPRPCNSAQRLGGDPRFRGWRSSCIRSAAPTWSPSRPPRSTCSSVRCAGARTDSRGLLDRSRSGSAGLPWQCGRSASRLSFALCCGLARPTTDGRSRTKGRSAPDASPGSRIAARSDGQVGVGRDACCSRRTLLRRRSLGGPLPTGRVRRIVD